MITSDRDSAADRIWGLVCGYAEPGRSRKLLLMLKAFIDDSHMGSGSVYILAGWVAEAKTWAAFVDEWDAVLRMSPRIKYFKYAEAMNFNGEFNGISKERRDEKVKLLMGIIEKYEPLAIATIIPRSIYKAYFGNDRGALRFPYVPSFFGIISTLVRHLASQGIEEKIEFVFDFQPGGSDQMGTIQKEWSNFVEIADPVFRKYLHNHPPSFLDDQSVIALQAADMHAGWLYDLASALEENRPIPTPIWGDIGAGVFRLTWSMNDKVAEEMHYKILGYRPIRFTFTFQYGLAAQPV